jgi:hypothetical protein
LSRRWLFRVIDPANELIPTERRQAFPQHQDFRIRSHCCLKVFTCFVDSALGKSEHHETSHQRHPKAEVTSFVQNGGFRVLPLDNRMSRIEAESGDLLN